MSCPPVLFNLDHGRGGPAVNEQTAVGGLCCGEGFLENPAFGPQNFSYAFDGVNVSEGEPIGPPHITVCAPYLLNAPGTRCDLFPAVSHDQQPAYSPTADHIVLMNDASGTPRLMITDFHGGHRHFLAPGSMPDWQPVVVR